MADRKISDLDAAGTLGGTEIFVLSQGGASRKLALSDLVTHIGASSYTYLGAKASLTTDKTAQDYTTATAVSWDAESWDDGGFWAVGNPTRFTIPAGVDVVRVTSTIAASSVNVNNFLQLQFAVNGSGQFGFQRNSVATTSSGITTSTEIDVSEGQYVEAFLRSQSDTSITLDADSSYMTIHAIKGSAVS